LEMDKFQ